MHNMAYTYSYGDAPKPSVIAYNNFPATFNNLESQMLYVLSYIKQVSRRAILVVSQETEPN